MKICSQVQKIALDEQHQAISYVKNIEPTDGKLNHFTMLPQLLARWPVYDIYSERTDKSMMGKYTLLKIEHP